jgi:hypothetical protein
MLSRASSDHLPLIDERRRRDMRDSPRRRSQARERIDAPRCAELASSGPLCFSSDRLMNIRPTPLTAAIAGAVAAVVWPLLWAKFGGAASKGSFELIIATLLVIALPAHAFVVGFGPQQVTPGRILDTALLKRVGAWLAAALGVTALRAAAGM